MDGSRFDRLTRDMVAGRTRRSVVKGIAGGLVAGVATLAGGRATLAGHKADHCAKEGQQAHLDQNHPKPCCAGLVAGPDGRCHATTPPPSVCAAGTDMCSSSVFCRQGPDSESSFCVCATTTEGGPVCIVSGNAPCGSGATACSSSAECDPEGTQSGIFTRRCVESPCCGGAKVKTCHFVCNTGA
jgi:hypothetical protein